MTLGLPRKLMLALLPLALAAGAPAMSQSSSVPQSSAVPSGYQLVEDPVLGDLNAELEIIEYASFACPHCAHFHSEVWPMLKTEFIDTGRVRFVMRPILTPPVQLAAAGSMLASCSGEDRYYDTVDLFFNEQGAIFDQLRAQQSIVPKFNQMGAAVGLDESAVQACLTDQALFESVVAQAQAAADAGVTGTPSFLIHGQLLAATRMDDGMFYFWGDEPLLLDGERVSGEVDQDSFRRIVVHFLTMSGLDE